MKASHLIHLFNFLQTAGKLHMANDVITVQEIKQLKHGRNVKIITCIAWFPGHTVEILHSNLISWGNKNINYITFQRHLADAFVQSKLQWVNDTVGRKGNVQQSVHQWYNFY